MKIYKQSAMIVIDRENNRDFLLVNSRDIQFEVQNNKILILYGYNNTTELVEFFNIKTEAGNQYGNTLDDTLINLVTTVS